MGINELFDGIAKVVGQFAEELAEQRLQEKMSRTGRGPKVRPEKTEKKGRKEKENYRDFPQAGLWRVLKIRVAFLQRLGQMDSSNISQSPTPFFDQ